MKTETRKAAYGIIAFVMFAAVLLLPGTRAYASDAPKADHIRTKQIERVEIPFDKDDYKVSGLRSSSKNLIVKATYVHSSKNKDSYSKDYPWGYATISVYAKKKGNYTVSFQVTDRSGGVIKSHSIKIYANDEEAVKNVTFAGEPYFYGIHTKTKGKFKVTMNKGYKLKSIVMTAYGKNGKEINKKIKNGKTVTLGKYRAKRHWTESYSQGHYENWDADLMALTKFAITYTDKYTKAAKTDYYTMCVIPKN